MVLYIVRDSYVIKGIFVSDVNNSHQQFFETFNFKLDQFQITPFFLLANYGRPWMTLPYQQ